MAEHPEHANHNHDGDAADCPECEAHARALFHDGEGLPIIHRHDIYSMIAMLVSNDDHEPQGMENFIAISLSGHRNDSQRTAQPVADEAVLSFAMAVENAAEFAFAILETVGPIINP